MKKLELQQLTQFLGNDIPANKIVNRDTRIAIVRLYSSIALAYKSVTDEIEEIRKSLVGDKQQEIEEYSKLRADSFNTNLSEEERNKAKQKADEMTDCVKIDTDFKEAIIALENEDVKFDIKKVPLEVLYEAFVDCDFKGLSRPLSLAETATMFSSIIL